jgi:hypothetical protein
LEVFCLAERIASFTARIKLHEDGWLVGWLISKLVTYTEV